MIKYTFVLNEKEFNISLTYEKFVTSIPLLSPKLGSSLVQNKKYNVESNVCPEVLKNFLNYWETDTKPEINSGNIFEYYLLSEEFGLNELMKNFPEWNEDRLAISCIICSSKEYVYDKSQNEEYIALHLGTFIDKYPNEMTEIPFNSLYNIFYHKKRVIDDEIKAYKFIVENAEKNKNYYILLGSLDGSKLNNEIVLDSLIKIKEHISFCPNVSSSFYISIQEQINLLNQTIEEEKKEKKKLMMEKQQIAQEKCELTNQKNDEIEKIKDEYRKLTNEKLEMEDLKNKEINRLKDENRKLTNEKLEMEDLKNKEINKLKDENRKLTNEKLEMEDLKNKEINKLKDENHKLYENQERLIAEVNRLKIKKQQLPKEIQNSKTMNNNQQYIHNRNSNDQSLSLKKEINSKNLNSEIKSQLKQKTNESQNILKSGTKQPNKREKNCSIPQLEKKQKLIESIYEIKPLAPPKNMYLYFDPYGRPINECEFPFEVIPYDLISLSPPKLTIDISAKTKPTIKRRWPQPEKIDISSLTFDDKTGELVLINQKELIQEEIPTFDDETDDNATLEKVDQIIIHERSKREPFKQIKRHPLFPLLNVPVNKYSDPSALPIDWNFQFTQVQKL